MSFHMTHHLALFTVALLLLSHAFTIASVADGRKPSMQLSPENRSKVNRLLQEYRAAGSNLEKKREICQKVLAINPAAAPLMLKAVERDLQPQLRKYDGKFQAQAAVMAKRKVGKIDFSAVMEMRKAVHDVQKLGDGFTKEVIVEKIDPVVQKLRAAFILDRSEVLDKSPDLRAERKKLEGLGQMWERCHAQLPPPAATEGQEVAAPASFESYLQGEEELAVSLAIPQDPRTADVLAMNSRLAEKLDPEEARAILALNVTRTLLGLPALAIDLRLCEAARDHARDMERLKFFSHESPVPGKTTPSDRAKLAGTTACSENILFGTSNGNSVHEGWFHSPGHHRNQMGNASRVGVGRRGTYFTQMFGR
ncbi:MAG: CAP domain-containing protein [Thermoguttaceae bacterium]|jgi:uncharacterized protein YkwD